MNKKNKKIKILKINYNYFFNLITITSFIFILVFSTFIQIKNVKAQDSGGGDGGKDQILESTISDISIVAGAGVGGAILGLSTLSFTDEPRKHLKNILIGASVGVIVGVAIVIWAQATKTQDQYSSNKKNIFINDQFYLGNKTKDFFTSERIAWHTEVVSEYISNSKINSSTIFKTILFSKTF
ncbi:MAG: hypothetical protein HQK51_16220 [Oligoflexia bacterium]|nr:hypothetical protein [Oligoflexia bacterium]